MKIGIFDSGLGGLIIIHNLIQALPQYDYLYQFLVTDLSENISHLAENLFADKIELEKVNIKTNEI